MLGFGKNKKINSDGGLSTDSRLEEREAELDGLDLKIEETLADIFEESRNRKFKLPKSAKIK